jgi:hypothetical protein
MTFTLSKRRLFVGLAAFLLAAAGVLWLARQALTGLAVNGLLQLAGASEISFTITEATPWRVQVDDIGFHVRGQTFAAKRVSFERPHWWTPSLGKVRVEQASAPVAIEALRSSPQSTAPSPDTTSFPRKLPFQELSLDGKLLLPPAAEGGPAIAVVLAAHIDQRDHVIARLKADGPGLTVQAEADVTLASSEVTFRLPAFALDLKTWQPFVQEQLALPLGDWVLEGKITGSAEGRSAGGQLTGSARLQLRESRAASTAKAIDVTGIEAEMEIIDFAHFTTKPATLRVRELRTGQLALRDLHFELQFENPKQLYITKATLQTLGGTVAAEPFRYRLDRPELDAVVVAEGINVEDVMALTPDLPAKASGRVNGRLPLRIDAEGLKFGTGWMQLKPGAYAEIQFAAAGLLTSGVSPADPRYAVMKKVESGLLKLKVSELRLDIRPPDAPENRSAQLHIAAAPVDPQLTAPVILDLNVNGPLEKLINLGLDSRISFGSKP